MDIFSHRYHTPAVLGLAGEKVACACYNKGKIENLGHIRSKSAWIPVHAFASCETAAGKPRQNECDKFHK